MFEALGLAGVLVLWGALGLVPSCAVLFAGRGRVSLWLMPFAFAAAVAAGALVPALGAKGGAGFVVSLGAAMAGGAVASGAVASAVVVGRTDKSAA